MRQLIILTSLALSIGGVVYAFVIPTIGKGKDEVLVRTWTETEVTAETPRESDSSKVEVLNNKRVPSLKSSLEEREVEVKSKPIKDTKHIAKETNQHKIKEITKKEYLKARPLGFSRAVQFKPMENIEIVTDTVVEKDVVQINDTIQ